MIIFLSINTNIARSENEFIILENFETYQNKNIFSEWLLRDDDPFSAVKIYSIKSEDGNQYLNANSNNDSMQIAKKVGWDIKKYPVLRWKWRTNILPEKGNEEINGKNDSGAALYVIFQRKKLAFLSWKYQPIDVIKYVWSTGLPQGSVINKKKEKLGGTIYEGRFIVLESGSSKSGSWITEERNVLNDYIVQFGNAPKYDPMLIAILTDSNNTETTANADYDDLIIKMK